MPLPAAKGRRFMFQLYPAALEALNDGGFTGRGAWRGLMDPGARVSERDPKTRVVSRA